MRRYTRVSFSSVSFHGEAKWPEDSSALAVTDNDVSVLHGTRLDVLTGRKRGKKELQLREAEKLSDVTPEGFLEL